MKAFKCSSPATRRLSLALGRYPVKFSIKLFPFPGSPSQSRRRTNSGGSVKIKTKDKKKADPLANQQRQQQQDSTESPSFHSLGKSTDAVEEPLQPSGIGRQSDHHEGPSPKKRLPLTTPAVASLTTSPEFRPPSVLSKLSQGKQTKNLSVDK